MFNFKKIGKKVLSSVLGATLAMGGFLNTQIVKADGYNEDDYWDPFTMLSNAKFILGNNKQKEIKNLEEKLNKTTGKVEDKTNFEEEIGNLLSENENAKNIYNAVKQFITCEEVDIKGSNTITIDDVVSYQIIGVREKAIVFIMVKNNNCTLTKSRMGNIKKDLASYGYSTTNGGNFYNYKNVNFIIRPKNRSEKFKIGQDAISGCEEATINLQGAKINTDFAINCCDKATINLQGAKINTDFAISSCEEATINAQEATISKRDAIDRCKKVKINLQGANIDMRCAISECDEATIYHDKSTKVPTGEKVSEEYLTYECGNVSLIDLSNNNNNNNSESNGDYDYSNHHDYKEGKKSFLNPPIVGGGILAVLAACLISIPVIGPIIEQHIKNRKTKVNIKKTNTNINTHTNK